MKYVVLFPNGKTLSFNVLALAQTYVTAYNGVLLNNPTSSKVNEEVLDFNS